MGHPLPTEQNLTKLVSEIVGKPTEVKKATPPYQPKPKEKFSFAYYLDDSGKKMALCLSDLQLTCAIGACLTMIPAGVAKDAAKSGDVPDSIFDNTKEVFNITSSLFNVPGSPHLRLGPSALVLSEPAPDLTADMAKVAERTDFKVTVPNYGEGFLSFRWIG